MKREPGLWLEDVPVPEIGVNDVLIQVEKTCICGTDLHIWKWDDWARKTIPVPMVVGHEFVGRIVQVVNGVGLNVRSPYREYVPAETTSAPLESYLTSLSHGSPVNVLLIPLGVRSA